MEKTFLENEWTEDIRVFVDFLEKNHPEIYANCDEEAMKVKFENILLSNDKTLANLVKFSMSYTSIIKDSHTGINVFDPAFNYEVAMDFKVVGDKVYIMDVLDKDSDSLFNEVIFINDKNILQILDDLEPYVAYNNEADKYYEMSKILLFPKMMKFLGVVQGEGYTISYNDNGTLKKVSLSYEQMPNYQSMVNPMIYDNLNEYNYGLKVFNKNVYIKYRLCHQSKGYKMDEFIKDFEHCMNGDNKVEKIIIDLRCNVGGDSSVISPFIEVLKKYLDDNIKLIVLIDNSTYSSGTLALADLKNIGAISVGEKTAGSYSYHYGEVVSTRLPNSKIEVNCSTKSYEFYEGRDGLELLIDENQKDAKMFQSFIPDHEVLTDFNSLKNGIDNILDYALKL